MRLRSKVEDGVYLVFAKDAFDLSWRSDVSLFEREVRSLIEYARIIERRTVVEFVEGDNVVVGVCED